MTKDELIQFAQQFVKEHPVFVLATAGEGGAPRMRWMGALLLEEPLTLYMACGASSRKMDQVRGNPQAQVMFQNAEFSEVVTLSGECEVRDEAEIKQRLWESLPAMEQYFKGPDDPGLGVLKFVTKRVELLGLQSHGETPQVAEL
jgi:general stress protein 26